MSTRLLYSLLLIQVPAVEEPGRELAVTAEDVIAGFQQNLSSFRTLRVTGRRIHAPAAAMKETLKRAGELTAEQIELQTRARAYHYQFWTDRVAFQLRSPDTNQLGFSPGDTFVFPDAPLSEQSLPSEYASLLVYTYDGKPQSGLRVWTGVREGTPMGSIYVTMHAGNEDCYLPPLATESPMEGFVPHAMDDFFLPGEEGLALLGVEEYRGVDTYILERRLADQRLTRAWSRDGDHFTVYWRHRAWVDPQRGYVPLRIERACFFVDNDRVYDDPWRLGPSYIVDVSDIREVDAGGYYPWHVVERERGTSPTEAARFYLPGEIISGAQPPPLASALWRETTWEIRDVRADLDMTGLFDVDFPEGTLYHDSRTSQPMRVVRGKAEPVLERPIPQADRRAGPPVRGRALWLVLANVLLVLALVLMLVYRRRIVRERP